MVELTGQLLFVWKDMNQYAQLLSTVSDTSRNGPRDMCCCTYVHLLVQVCKLTHQVALVIEVLLLLQLADDRRHGTCVGKLHTDAVQQFRGQDCPHQT